MKHRIPCRTDNQSAVAAVERAQSLLSNNPLAYGLDFPKPDDWASLTQRQRDRYTWGVMRYWLTVSEKVAK